MKEKKKVGILTYSNQQFQHYLKSAKEDEEWVYIDRPEKLLGVEFSRIDILGTFWDRKDAGKLYEEVECRFPHLID